MGEKGVLRAFKKIAKRLRALFRREHIIADEPMVYKIVGGQYIALMPLEGEGVSASILPQGFHMAQGRYGFAGKVYDCQEPALYRFIQPQKELQQRVVLDGEDMPANARHIASMMVRGNKDDGRSLSEMIEVIPKRLLSLTCGYSAQLVMHALHAVGGKARVVHSYTDAACNSYNNGHTMLEVWDEKTNSYVLVDTDKKTSFSLNDAPVNLFDFSQAIVQQKPYAIGCPSNAAMLDAVGFTNDVGNFDYGALELFWGSSPEAMRLFYQRVASFPAISEEGVLYVCAWNEGAKHADIFKQLRCELLEPDAFCQRFYTL